MIAIDMEMPLNCVECRFSQGDYGFCHAMPENFCGYVYGSEDESRPGWCPLIPIIETHYKDDQPYRMVVNKKWRMEKIESTVCEPENCQYGDLHTCANEIARDAITLLKAQEPRVMTWQDVIGAAIECKPIYIEVKDSLDKEPGDDRWAMVTQYKDSIANGMIRAMSSYITSEILFAEDYDKRFRCWTSYPTNEQREATPWN